MKKLLFVSMTMLLLAGGPLQAGNAPDEVQPAAVRELTGNLQRDLGLLNQAADEGKFKKVISLANQVLKEAKQLKPLVPAQDPVAIINEEPTPGYLLLQAQTAEEFLLIAQILVGKARLAQVLNQRPDLLEDAGFFGWVSGNVKRMSPDLAPMAEQFRAWDKCEEELNFAQAQGVSVRPAHEVCAAE